MGKSGLSFGPTMGYLVGMVMASYWIGMLLDRGWTKTFSRSYLAAFSGSCMIFFCGVVGLSFFLPAKDLFAAGVLPFLPGDFIKTLLAAYIAHQSQKAMLRKI